ncbi:hypothetical protein PR048_025027 [Dryococelus australis]|uniref:Uncharacterized protein n=1 Tax=Dryococelus australis TaxID=614101 RepID=A0ABQ9GQ76_9NEOP|nr:hypothetical protein PR048_025027 [Dryococelus australis]
MRNKLGASSTLCKDLRVEDQSGYEKFFRLNVNQYTNLLNIVKNTIQKNYTNMGRALPAEVKLGVALRFLASGDSYSSLQYLFRIPKNSIRKFIPEVLDAIYNGFEDYIKV